MFNGIKNTLLNITSILLISLFITACDDQTIDEVAENISAYTEDLGNVRLSGKAIKGVIENAAISIYAIKNGVISSDLLATTYTNSNGEFSAHIPRKYARRLLYLELTASNSQLNPTTMVCDAFSGCGEINGELIEFGDKFMLSNDFLLRNVVKLDGSETFMPAHFSPLRHMVVAKTESNPDGFTWSNVDAASMEVSQLFSLQTPVHQLTPVDLTAEKETLYLAGDEEILAAIIDASFLNIGEYPNYKSVTQVLDELTLQHGTLEEGQDTISASELMLAASSNIPGTLMENTSVVTYFDIGENNNENPVKYTLNFNLNGNGSVKSADNRVNCSTSACTYSLDKGHNVSLTASSSQGYEFDRWEGACSGSTATCLITLNANTQITASFKEIMPAEPVTYLLNVSTSSSGSVRTATNDFTCNTTNCTKSYAEGSNITLIATPNDGFEFDHWSGQCNGSTSDHCAIVMSADRPVSVIFKEIGAAGPTTHSLNISISSSGSVQTTTNDFTCSAINCTKSYAEGSSITLIATPNEGFEFDHWAEQCNDSTSDHCTIIMSADRVVSAIFKEIMPESNFNLSISISGSGSVQNIANNINCDTNCSNTITEGTNLILMATAENGFEFSHWTTSCNNSTDSQCAVTMNNDVTISAVFTESVVVTGIVNVSWTAPSEREDGVQLAPNEIKQYVIYYRESQSQPYEGAAFKTVEDNGDGTVDTSLVIPDLEKGKTYYLAGVTIDTNGLTSQLSNEIIKVVQ